MRQELSLKSDKREVKAQAGQIRNEEIKEQVGSGKIQVPSKAKGDPMLLLAWKLLYPRTPRLASPRRIVPSKRGRLWDSDLEG